MGRTLPFPPLPALAPARAAGLPAAGGPPPAVHDASGTARDLQAGEDGTRSLRAGCTPGRRHTVGQSSDLAQWTPLRSWAGLAPGQVWWLDNVFIGRPWRSPKHGGVLLSEQRDVRGMTLAVDGWLERHNRGRLHRSRRYATPREVYRPAAACAA